MNIHSILCPVDFSESSDAALRYASLMASESGACLHIVHVEEALPEYPPDFVGYGIGAGVSEEQRVQHLLKEIRPSSEGVRFEHHHLKGSPAREIIDFADRNKIDLIVMGTHGRKGLTRLLMGSVAESVMRRATCPVLTLRQPVPTTEETPAAQCSAAEQ
ncbi:MAG: universal stress protein [Planctomycetales bacterium]|nr:universal stress protein [Planctomycetales bacterium]